MTASIPTRHLFSPLHVRAIIHGIEKVSFNRKQVQFALDYRMKRTGGAAMGALPKTDSSSIGTIYNCDWRLCGQGERNPC